MSDFAAAPATQLLNAWYAVARSADLGTNAPLERTIAGTRIALFRDTNGVRAVHARCPHRGGNLARGKVVDGCVRCPYHGWAFDGSGACTAIPSNPPDLRVPPEFVVPAYQAREQDGFVWVCIGAPPGEPPDLAFLEAPGLTGFVMEDVVDLPFDWWVENVLDVSHVAVAHDGSYAATDAYMPPFNVERWPDDLGYSASVKLNQKYGFWARLIHRELGDFSMDVRIDVWMPGTVVFHVDLPGGRKQLILTVATPVDDTHTHYIVVPLRNYFRFPGANAIGRYFTRKVLDEDIALGRESLAPVTLAVDDVRSVRADAPSIEYLRLLRRWIDREG